MFHQFSKHLVLISAVLSTNFISLFIQVNDLTYSAVHKNTKSSCIKIYIYLAFHSRSFSERADCQCKLILCACLFSPCNFDLMLISHILEAHPNV